MMDDRNVIHAASDVKSGSSKINFGEFKRLEGLSPFARAFCEKNAHVPESYFVVIVNGVFSLEPPQS